MLARLAPMRILGAIPAVLLVALAMAGCGSSSSETTGSNPAANSSTAPARPEAPAGSTVDVCKAGAAAGGELRVTGVSCGTARQVDRRLVQGRRLRRRSRRLPHLLPPRRLHLPRRRHGPRHSRHLRGAWPLALVPRQARLSPPNPPRMQRRAGVAQLVEHFTRNEGVPGSNPGVGLPPRRPADCSDRSSGRVRD